MFPPVAPEDNKNNSQENEMSLKQTSVKKRTIKCLQCVSEA